MDLTPFTARDTGRLWVSATTCSSGREAVQWLGLWGTRPTFNLKKSTIASAAFSIVFGCVSAAFAAYELHKQTQFMSRYNAAQWEDGNDKEYYNKDYQKISEDVLLYHLRIAAMEKGITVSLICVSLALVGASILLIFCALKSTKEFAIPWLFFMTVMVTYGTVIVMMDCVTYKFTGENNLQLLIWVSFVVGSVHCYRRVVAFYRGLVRGDAGVCASSSSLGNENVVFSTSQSGESTQPVVIQLTPPPYEKDPPKYSLTPEDSTPQVEPSQLDTEQDKPPDYQP